MGENVALGLVRKFRFHEFLVLFINILSSIMFIHINKRGTNDVREKVLFQKPSIFLNYVQICAGHNVFKTGLIWNYFVCTETVNIGKHTAKFRSSHH